MRRWAVACARLLAGCSGPLTLNGSQVPVAEATRTAETTYPNGPQCAAGGNQAAIEIDQKGIR